MLATLNAVAADKTFSIQAAVDGLPLNAKRIAASIGLKLDRKLTVAEVDRAFCARTPEREFSVTEKIATKVALERAGLLL
jgi:hypothetical protein